MQLRRQATFVTVVLSAVLSVQAAECAEETSPVELHCDGPGFTTRD
jgi:hypothetical protein